MKQIIILALAVLTLASCQQQKIGYIDNGKVINEIEEKKALEASFKIKEEVFNKKADSLQKSFQLEAQDFNLRKNKMSKVNQDKRYNELVQKSQLQEQQLQFEKQQLAQAFRTEMDSVILKLKDYAKAYGKDNGYDFILGSSDASSSVLYGKENTDLSQVIIDGLNADFKE